MYRCAVCVKGEVFPHCHNAQCTWTLCDLCQAVHDTDTDRYIVPQRKGRKAPK